MGIKPSDMTPVIDFNLHHGTGPFRTRRPVYVDLLPPCNHACPAGENVQAWLGLAQAGKYRQAWEMLVRDNPMPAIHGRVCFHPCENACNRGALDASVSIHAVERFLGDLASRESWSFKVDAPRSRKRVLVIGAGPSGLSAAYHLTCLGIKAGQLARALGARLELFHAISPWPYFCDYDVPRVELREIERKTRALILTQLEKIAAPLRRRRIEVTVAGEWDHPAYEAIIRRARHIKADLIVAGQHAGDHSVAGLLHLTDWELLRLAPVPVLLVKARESYRHPIVIAAIDNLNCDVLIVKPAHFVSDVPSRQRGGGAR